MKCLLVIDLQEDYVGTARNQKRYPYEAEQLIAKVNQRISEYPKESVIYITNSFFWESKKKTKHLVKGLSIVSDQIIHKRKSSCFSNSELLEYLQNNKVKELELAGVDGNYCVGASAWDGRKKGFEISIQESKVGVGNHKKFLKTKAALEKAGVQFVG